MAIPKEKTKRGLFIIESLDRADEKSRREGVIIKQILTLSESLPVEYIYTYGKDSCWIVTLRPGLCGLCFPREVAF